MNQYPYLSNGEGMKSRDGQIANFRFLMASENSINCCSPATVKENDITNSYSMGIHPSSF